LRLTPVVESGQTFAKWWVKFECGTEDRTQWNAFFEAGLRRWMASLDAHIGRAIRKPDAKLA
jgi:hypothetical protein